jgi:hypothetical protein
VALSPMGQSAHSKGRGAALRTQEPPHIASQIADSGRLRRHSLPICTPAVCCYIAGARGRQWREHGVRTCPCSFLHRRSRLSLTYQHQAACALHTCRSTLETRRWTRQPWTLIKWPLSRPGTGPAHPLRVLHSNLIRPSSQVPHRVSQLCSAVEADTRTRNPTSGLLLGV